jgi:hypothetical protein
MGMTQTTPELIDWQPGQQANHNGNVVTLITFPTSSGYTPARLGHRCGLGTDCRRWDVDGGTAAFAWECELSPVAETAVTRSVAAGNVIVRLTETRGIYRVTVEYASTGQQIPEFCWTTDNREAAYAALTRRVQAFDQGTTVEQAKDAIGAAAKTTPAPARLRSAPIAKGHQLDMSPSQAAAILIAGVGGTIDRGASAVGGVPTGRLTDTQIRAAAERGWVRPLLGEGRRRRIVGCQPTPTGWAHAKAMQATKPATTDVVA